MAKGDAPLDHHGSLFLQEHLCLCYSLWEVKPRRVIAIVTHLCSVSPALRTNPAPPAPATWGPQTDVADVFSLQSWQQRFFFSNGEGVPQSWFGQALNAAGPHWCVVRKWDVSGLPAGRGLWVRLGPQQCSLPWSTHDWQILSHLANAVMVLVRTMFWGKLNFPSTLS